MAPFVFIVIPAYNESSVIIQTLEELINHGYKNIIVVDDGSTDKTSVKLAELKARHSSLILIRHMLNRGKGAAVKTGLEAAKLLKADFVITFDGDGQHDPSDVSVLVKKLKEGTDVVLGRRNFSEKHIPLVKKIGNIMGNFFTWCVYGLWVNDSQSGLRGFNKKALSLIETSSDRYEYDSEVIREIARNKLIYSEIPMHVRYTSYSQKKLNKQSPVNAVKTVIKMFLKG
jgi:glycosyltransferase involved in cell wall biosynthesis